MNFEAMMDQEEDNDLQQDGPFTDRKLLSDQFSNKDFKKKVSMEIEHVSVDLSEN